MAVHLVDHWADSMEYYLVEHLVASMAVPMADQMEHYLVEHLVACLVE